MREVSGQRSGRVDSLAVGEAILVGELTVLETRKGVTASSRVRVCREGPRHTEKQVEELWLRHPFPENHPQLALPLVFAPYPLLPGLPIPGCCVSLPVPLPLPVSPVTVGAL